MYQSFFLVDSNCMEHSIFFSGQLVNTLGKDSDIEARTQAILLENDVDTAEFTEEVTRSLPGDLFFLLRAEIQWGLVNRKICPD
jgi:hypothetical protein